MTPRVSISNYNDATAIYEALETRHALTSDLLSLATTEQNLSAYANEVDHLAGLMVLVADEVLRIGNLPAETVAEYVDRASLEDMQTYAVLECGVTCTCPKDNLCPFAGMGAK